MKATMDNDRTYQITAIETGPNVAKMLISKGYECTMYMGVSKPTGRKRITMEALMVRDAKTGKFDWAM